MKLVTRVSRQVGPWLAVLLLTLTALGPAAAQAIRVSEVEITGNQKINRESILTVVTTKKGDEFSAERLERDRLAIAGLGWFRTVAAEPVRQGDEVRVIFRVVEYPVVTDYQVTGSSIFKDAQIREKLKLRTGEVFNEVNFDADMNALEKLYTDKGYFIRRVTNIDQPDFQQRGILRVEIHELKVGNVKLKWPKKTEKEPEKKKGSDKKKESKSKDKKGTDTAKDTTTTAPDATTPDTTKPDATKPDATKPDTSAADTTKKGKSKKSSKNAKPGEEMHKTKNYVVLRELSQKPGALYNEQQLGKDYRKLSGLGFFESIVPTRTQGEAVDTVDITWELTEKRTGQVSVGAGYSPRQQLIGRAELADTNFRGKGQSLSVSGEIGTFGGDGAPSVEVQFHEPWLTKNKTSMTVNLHDKLVYRFSQSLLSHTRADTRYFERRLGGSLAFGRPFQWPVTLGIRYDDVNTKDLPAKFDFPRQNGQVGAFSATRTHSTRDYVNNPTTGDYLRLNGEVGIAHIDPSSNTGGDFGTAFFNKYVADFRKYVRLKHLKAKKEPEREQESQKIPVLAIRAMAGTTLGKVPFFEQYFMGGAESLRGYREDRFWGKYMYLGSAEYRRPLVNRVVGVLFVDVGDAFGSDSDFQFGSKKLRTDFRQHNGFRPFGSVGLGLRVATPIGPIRLDYGYGEEGGRVHFSIGHAF